MINNKKLIKIGRKTMAALLIAAVALTSTGCGGQADANSNSDAEIELLNPTGVALNYETAVRRTLYDYKVYSALITPYSEEYELKDSQTFEEFTVYPGESVKAGGVLLHSSTENIDKQIENLQKSIKEMEESYEEYMKETEESLVEPRKQRDYYKECLDKHLLIKPAETITVTDSATGAVTVETNPEYTSWKQNYDYADGYYSGYYISVEITEEAMRQKTALYELDHAYYVKQLNRLKADRKEYTLISEMSGTVSSVKYLGTGDWMSSETPLVAVSDLNRKELKCEYINKTTIAKAKDVYALVNGKRYEIEYNVIDTDEYKRLEELNGKVYTTFDFKDSAEDLEMGGYAAVIVLNKEVDDVIAVPKDAVKKDETTQYVYVVEGNESIYTPVKVGMSDGVYTEIVSGLEEGAKVLTEKASTVTGKTTDTVKPGSISHSFTSTGYMYYPSSRWISNGVKYGTTYIQEVKVSLYQQVKKGDVIATVRVQADNVSLNRNKQKLVRANERLAEIVAARDKETDKDAIKNYDKQIESKKESIADLEKLIKEMSADFATKTITAPVDGIITNLYSFDEDSILNNGAKICQISEQDRSYLFVADDNGQLTYGNIASIKYKDADGRDCVAKGEVVTLNSMVASQALTSGNRVTTGYRQENSGALVMLSAEDAGNMAGSSANDNWWTRTSYSVEVTIRSVENVLIIPKRAVKETNGVTYVNVKQEDGTIVSRSFVAGGSNNSYYWVADGLTEGMEICLE